MGVSEQRQQRQTAVTSRPSAAHVGVAQRLIDGAARLPDARQLRDDLVAAGLSPDRVTLVGRDLEPVTDESGRGETATVAARGALPGLITGALVGAVLRVTGLVEPVVTDGWLVFAAALLGAVFGAVAAVIGQGMLATRRAAARASLVRVGYVDLLVDADIADQAVRLRDGQARADTGTAE